MINSSLYAPNQHSIVRLRRRGYQHEKNKVLDICKHIFASTGPTLHIFEFVPSFGGQRLPKCQLVFSRHVVVLYKPFDASCEFDIVDDALRYSISS